MISILPIAFYLQNVYVWIHSCILKYEFIFHRTSSFILKKEHRGPLWFTDGPHRVLCQRDNRINYRSWAGLNHIQGLIVGGWKLMQINGDFKRPRAWTHTASVMLVSLLIISSWVAWWCDKTLLLSSHQLSGLLMWQYVTITLHQRDSGTKMVCRTYKLHVTDVNFVNYDVVRTLECWLWMRIGRFS